MALLHTVYAALIKSAVFDILVALADRDGKLRLSPGTLYLYGSIKRMLQDGLIEELEERPDPEHDDVRRRYYRLTALGRAVAMAESARFAKLLGQARASGLAPKRT